MDLNNAIAKHANGLRVSAHLYRPRIFRRVLGEERPTVSWQTLCLASGIQQSQLPLYTKNAWYIRAVLDLLLDLGLVVQIELSIYWNNIQGLNDPTSFGQLLALVLGVGGLVKVLLQKLWNMFHGKSEADLRPKYTSYEQGFDVYPKWKHRNVDGLRDTSRTQLAEMEKYPDENFISILPFAKPHWHRRSR